MILVFSTCPALSSEHTAGEPPVQKVEHLAAKDLDIFPQELVETQTGNSSAQQPWPDGFWGLRATGTGSQGPSINPIKQHQVAIRGTAASCKFGCLNSILGVTGRFAEQSFRKHRITLSMFRNPRRMFNTRPYFHGGETSRSSDRRSLHLEICSTSLTGASSCQQTPFRTPVCF